MNAENQARAVEVIERNAHVLTRIVEDVLDVSRIISGKLRLDVQPVELPRVLHEAIATVRPAADDPKLEIDLGGRRGADPARLNYRCHAASAARGRS